MEILNLFLILLFYFDIGYCASPDCGSGCSVPLNNVGGCASGEACETNGVFAGSGGEYCITSTSTTCQAFNVSCGGAPGFPSGYLWMDMGGGYVQMNSETQQWTDVECQLGQWHANAGGMYYPIANTDLYCTVPCTSGCPATPECGWGWQSTTDEATTTTTPAPTFTTECTTGCPAWVDGGDCTTQTCPDGPAGSSNGELCIHESMTTCQGYEITCSMAGYTPGYIYVDVGGSYVNIANDAMNVECRAGGVWWGKVGETWYEITGNTVYCSIACSGASCPAKPPCSSCVWSEWAAASGNCNDTCGMCGSRVAWERKCPPSCTCDTTNNSTITEYCPAKACTFPRGVCCNGHQRIRLTNGTFICIDPATYTTAAPGKRKRSMIVDLI